jgi:hypothetical protein
MMDQASNPTHVRSALFVDFDNIYLGLQNEDPNAAEQFATHPGRWLRWLQEDLPTDSPLARKILSRRCYLNPSQFSRFRPYFIRSAFEVVDCPPLTRGGKTSADIQMVMDIMDALGHVTRFEEFIILSGDADFTPVLLRLSRHDRRSVVLAAGPASTAYKAACDLLIDQDSFLEEAIGIAEGSPVRPSADSELLQRIAARVQERAGTGGELVATDLPSIFREFAEFTPDSNWLGFYSLRGMTNAVVQARADLEMLEGDPWRVRVRAAAAGAAEPSAAGAATGTGAPAATAAQPPRPDQAAGAAAADDDGPSVPGGGEADNGAGTAAPPASAPAAAVTPQLLRAIADKVYARASAAGELLATDLPGIYRDFPQFTPTSNWLGFYSLRGLSDAVIRSRDDLAMVDGDPWRVRVRMRPPQADPGEGRARPAGAALPSGTRAGAAGHPAADGADPWPAGRPAAAEGDDPPAADGDATEREEREHQIEAIVDFLRAMVAGSDSPVPMARAAQSVIARFGDGVVASRWFGAGTFRDLLAGRSDLAFAVSVARPGYLYDPDLHQTPLEQAEDLEIGDPGLSSLAHRIHRVTDTPYLAPDEYALVFREIAEEVNEEGYFLTRTSKAVRDRCIEEGAPVARTSVNFILRGITSAGHQFAPSGRNDPRDLANAFLKNVLGLCESAGMPLSEEERQQLADWIAGGLPAPTPAGGDSAGAADSEGGGAG